jgi:cytochrome b subunit of formate dehydrogenase
VYAPTLSNRVAIGVAIGIVVTALFVGCTNTSPRDRSAKSVGLSAADSLLEHPNRAMGVCPPFKLRDESGTIIDPKHGENASVPCSPKQTCGASGCHNYDRISQGFHFQQGKDEKPSAEYAARYNWISHPGNYGGNWCSPAPLYRQLAPKKNRSAREIDMTSFEFVTATCGNCHAGGGPMEYDREGHRYDEWMRQKGYVPGGENDLDGDYYKARWSETGVIETDCNLCHVPEYNYKERNAQLAKLNFKWAATAGADFATVSGSVAQDETPTVTYDLKRFDDDGNIIMHIVPEPRNETCLRCHFKPDWKKRGAAYSNRTDVHMVAGLRCVDCHAAGSKAADPRIRGWEVHQFGKGDDPSGFVRNDLDNTVRTCEDCHLKGWRNAPVAKHDWLPPLHMEKLSCQACHIPSRAVKSALVQASDIYNPAPRISPPGKHIWAFYDQDMQFWNHYGELELFIGSDEPTDVSNPTLIRYKGKIYPANRVHSAWVGFEEQGKPGLNQVFMKDFYLMWVEHRKDPARNYPALAAITDDNGDALIEVNRPQEIDSLLRAVHQYLKTTAFPLENRRLVWVSDDRAYYSSREWRLLPRQSHEATPYASVYKFSHDVAPARAALGAHGCKDCHSAGSTFFFGAVLAQPFDSTGKPVWTTQSRLLGYDGSPPRYSGVVGGVAAFFKWLTIVVMTLLIGHIVLDFFARARSPKTVRNRQPSVWVQRYNHHFRAQHLVLMLSVSMLFVSGLFYFALRYPGAAWSATLSEALGGPDFWRVIHRIGGVLLIAASAYHIIYSILHEEGRRDFLLMLPVRDDFKHAWHNLKCFLGVCTQRPNFGRFTYFEKFDYWAVFWGCFIMIGTGLAMWFHDLVLVVFPKISPTAFNAFKEAHAHEAVLAFLAIMIWHVYNVHLRAGRLRWNWVWVHGRVSLDEVSEEHPLDPTVRGFDELSRI